MKPLYHIGFGNEHKAKYVLLPGDPARVEKIAQFLENPRFFHQNREYTTWIGQIAGENVLVMSTGMGGPSTAIAVEELYQTGITHYIRIGTCGGMNLAVKGGDLVVANAAIRMEGTTREYVPIEFPAVSNLDITNALVQAAKNNNYPCHAGIVQCKDSFYGQHDPDRIPIGYELKEKWNAWIKAGCLASEMESATLFIVAQILGVKAGCVLNTIWNQERKAQGLEDVECHDTAAAIQTAVEAIRLLIIQELANK